MTLDEAIMHCEYKSDCTECGKEHAQLAVWLKELKALKQQPKQDWIPVSEKLPAPYETVLATGKMEKDKEPLVYMGCVNGRGEWKLLGVRNPEDYITSAWRYLPEPYKGE